jgi:hypothetical protein
MRYRSEWYRARAKESQVRAEASHDPEVKLAYERLAAKWLILADQVERQDAPVRTCY